MVTSDLKDLPIHTNKILAEQKAKRKTISQRSQNAVDSGDLQAVVDSLSDRQRQFCEEYLKDLNATQAVIRAGYQTKFPNRIGFQLMENAAVRIAIDALRAERSKGTDVTKDFVLRGIQKAIRLAEESGNLNALLRGHELLARHLGMFIERTEISGPDGEAIRMEQKTKEDVDKFTNSIVNLVDKNKA
jgi:phage terminase small subunit